MEIPLPALQQGAGLHLEPFARGQVPSPCSKEKARRSGSGRARVELEAEGSHGESKPSATPGQMARDIESMDVLLRSFWHYLENKTGAAETTASAYS